MPSDGEEVLDKLQETLDTLEGALMALQSEFEDFKATLSGIAARTDERINGIAAELREMGRRSR